MDLDEEELKATRILNGVASADEMFEKLGYEKRGTKFSERYVLYSGDDELLIKIVFNNTTKRCAIHCDGDALDVEELQAINKKCKELGWI